MSGTAAAAASPSAFNAVATLDALRAQNIALQVQLSSQERELAQCRHALKLALTKAGSWGTVRHRVVLSKSLNPVPVKAWPPVVGGGAHQDDGARASELIEGLSAQVAQAKADLAEEHRTRQEQEKLVASLREQLAGRPAAGSTSAAGAGTSGGADAGGKPSNAIVAHLMAQIKFLHEEVERLEGVAADARDRGAQSAEGATKRLVKDLALKDREIERLNLEVVRARGASHSRSRQMSPVPTDGPTYHELAQQFEDALADKKAALTEKNDLQAKVRKLEAAIKDLKTATADIEKQKTRTEETSAFQARDLNQAVASIAKEKEQLQGELMGFRRRAATPHYSIDVQCDVTPVAQRYCQTDALEPTTQAAACQVDTVRPSLDPKLFDEYGDSGLPHAFEAKCRELDSCRAALEEMREESTFAVGAMKRLEGALADEAGRRRAAEAECDRLGIQVRALQQQASQLQVHVRDAQAQTRQAEYRMQEALAASTRAEEERRLWESHLSNNAKDMDTLIAQQAVATSQVAAAAHESDALRDEVQKALHREAQLQYELKAKQAELAEILSAYQQCVRECDTLSGHVATIERECDNLRSLVSVRDERIHGMSEQIDELHRRDQQLTLDLQSVDYENGLLHRKLVAAQNDAAQLDAHLQDTGKALQASQQVIQEFERTQAEMHKQLVVKENEIMLLRQRTDDISQEYAAASHAQKVASRRVADLEDAQARLQVKGLLNQAAQQSAGASVEATLTRQREDNERLAADKGDLERRLRETQKRLEETTASLREATIAAECMRDDLADLREQRDALVAARDRLESLVREQAETLAALDEA
jgi:DNA repair exonuclease SbcCD ATPase subunit